MRVRATTVTRTDSGLRTPSPSSAASWPGLRRPEARVLGLEFAGVVEAGRGERHASSPSATGSSGCGLAHTPSTSAIPASRVARAHAGRPDVRGGRSCLRRSSARPCLFRKAGALDGRASSSTARRAPSVRPACSSPSHFGAPRHGRVQHEERRARAVARRRRGRRLHCRRTSRTAARRTTSSSTPSASTSFRRCRRSLRPGGVFLETDLGSMLHFPLARLATRSSAEAGGARVHEVPEGGRSAAEVAHRERGVPAGPRSDLPVRRCDRGDEVRRDRAEDGQRGVDDRRRRCARSGVVKAVVHDRYE